MHRTILILLTFLTANTFLISFSAEGGSASGGQTFADSPDDLSAKALAKAEALAKSGDTKAYPERSRRVDSLLNELKTTASEKKPEILNWLADEYLAISPETALKYVKKAYNLAKMQNNRIEEAYALKNFGNVFYDMDNYKKSLMYYKKALKRYEELSNSSDEIIAKSGKEGIANSLNNIGNIYNSWGNYKKTIEYYKKSLNIQKKIGNKEGVAISLNNIGIVYYYWGNYNKTIEYFQKTLRIYEEINDSEGIAGSLNNIGNVYRDWGNSTKANEYFQSSLKLYEQLGDKESIAGLLLNIGLIYKDGDNYKKAIDYFQKSLKIRKQIGDKQGIATTMSNMGDIFAKFGDNEKALEYYQKSLNIDEVIGYKEGIARSLRNIGNIYKVRGNYKKALTYYAQSLQLAKDINHRKIIMSNYESFSEAYISMVNYQKAYEYFKQYTALKDSIFNEETHKQIAEMQTKYETEKKEKQIILLNKEKEVKDLELTKRQAEIKKQRILIYSFILGFIVILIFSVLLYHQYNQKKKANILLAHQNIEINQQKEEITVQRDEITAQRDEIKLQRDLAAKQRDQISEQKKEITDSILYAKHIQSAILPPDEYLNKILPEHFILFKPRDIVSGDFYWATVKKSVIARSEATKQSVGNNPQVKKIASPAARNDVGLLIFAVVDCTGHGVPGAFMSMLGVSFLNEIMGSNISLQANVILNKLREYVMKSLHQTGKQEEAKDGMDIALISIDTENNMMQFAGANNPLYIIRTVIARSGATKQSNSDKEQSQKIASPDTLYRDRNDGYELIEIKADLSAVTEGAKNEKHILYEVKADKMPIGIQRVEKIADLPSFTNHEIKLVKGDTIYMFSDGFIDQFGGPGGKKFKSKQFKQLLVNIHQKDMAEQKAILDKTIEDWKGDLEQIDDILVMGIRI